MSEAMQLTTWAYELALRVKHHVMGVERFGEILARPTLGDPAWCAGADADFIIACLADEVLRNGDGRPSQAAPAPMPPSSPPSR